MSPTGRIVVVVALVLGGLVCRMGLSEVRAQETPAVSSLLWTQDVGPVASDELARFARATFDLGETGVFFHEGSQAGVWFSDGTRRGTRLALPGLRSFGGFTESTAYALGVDGDVLWAVTPGELPERPVAAFDSAIRQDWRDFFLGSVPERDLAFFRVRRWNGAGWGIEPWVSDGTPAGTRLLGDLRSGVEASSDPRAGVGIGDLFLFAADDDSGQFGVLYATDGTSAGTRSIPVDADGDFFHGVSRTVSLGRSAVFTAVNGGTGIPGLYVSDGTTGGTRRLRGISPRTRITELVVAPDASRAWLVFQNSGDLTGGVEVWTTDGTVAGTERIGEVEGSVSQVASHRNDLYLLIAKDNSMGLYRVGATGRFVELRGDGQSEFEARYLLTGFFGADGTDLFYFAADDELGTEVWRTDGTETGARRVADLCPGPCPGAPAFLTVVRGRPLAVTTPFPDRRFEQRLVALDGPTPTLLFDLPAGADGIEALVTQGDDFALWAVDEGQRRRLWTTDGTPEGTRAFDPIVPQSVDLPVEVLVEQDGATVFLDLFRSSLWRTDGTVSGTREIWQSEERPRRFQIVSVGGALVFVPEAGPEFRLWVSDGTASGTLPGDIVGGGLPLQRVGDTAFYGLQPVDPDEGRLLPALAERESFGVAEAWDIVALGDRLYFTVDGFLHSSDGTPEGTLREFPGLKFVSGLRRVENRLVFAARGEDGGRLRVWDPVSGALQALEGSPPEILDSVGTEAVVAGGRYVFTDVSGLYATDRALTTIRKLVPRTGVELGPRDLLAFGPLVAFVFEDPELGVELWRTDGTVAGTGVLRDLAAGAADSDPDELRVVGDRLIFEAWTPATGRELFVSDGTTEGTVLLVDHVPGTLAGRRGSDTEGTASVGGGLLYAAWSPEGKGVWLLGSDIEQDPAPPVGPWLTSARVPGFRFKVRITDQQGGAVVGAQEANCIEETLCVSGALPGRSEAFLRVVGPKPNGFLWPTLAKFTTSRVEVWIEREDGGARRYYLLPGATAGGPDVLPALFDRQGFAAEVGQRAGEPVHWRDVTGVVPWALEPGEPEIPAGSEGIVSAAVPGFRFHVRLTSQTGDELPTREEVACIDETVCVSGSVPGRSELFLRVIGPRPNGFLWPTLVRFTTSDVEVWVEQLATGEVRYYRLPAATPGSSSLDGLFDRQGFR